MTNSRWLSISGDSRSLTLSLATGMLLALTCPVKQFTGPPLVKTPFRAKEVMPNHE
jgi:hypothetical protein